MSVAIRASTLAMGALFLCAVALAADPAKKEPEGPPVNWCESMEEGRAAALKADRPIVLVFPAADAKRHEWFVEANARDAANASNVIMVRATAPQQVNLPADATAAQRQALLDAQKKLFESYQALANKYSVTMVPTVLYLSPDGETVLRAYRRAPETTVVAYLRCLESDFANFKKFRRQFKTRLAARKIDFDKTRFPDVEENGTYVVKPVLNDILDRGTVPLLSPVGLRPVTSTATATATAAAAATKSKSSVTWFNRLKPAIEDATRADRPILLVLPAADAQRHEWFYGVDVDATVSGGKVTPACILPPAEFFVPQSDAKRYGEYEDLRRELFGVYRDMCTKYRVTQVPTVLFLSPDGETVLKSWPRAPETAVAEYLKSLPADFANYKKLRSTMQANKKPDDPPKTAAGTPAQPAKPEDF